MYLEKLELTGFKSFAKKTILSFPKRQKENPGITAIVGPNGSGKSNVADAVRWVLGEQSIKLLRGKRAEDVIFSGSHTKARLGFAEVALHLNNEDRSTDIEYANVVVGRRVYRDGCSEYRINNSKVRLADVQLLLAQANFGQRTYSVIGQGMADHILSATPQERKNFFDEATGVKQYQIKREQSLQKLETTEENLAQARGLLAEITPRMRLLERQIERLEKRGALEQELAQLHIRHFGSQWHAVSNDVETLSDQKKNIAHSHLELTKKLVSLQSTLDELAAKQKQAEHSDYDAIQKEHLGLMQKKQELAARLSGLARERALLAEAAKKASNKVDTNALLDAGAEYEHFLERLLAAENLEAFKKLQTAARALHKKLVEILNPKQARANTGEAQIARLDEEIASLEKEVRAQEERIVEKQRQLNEIRKAQTQTASGAFDAQKQYQDLQKDLNALSEKKNAVEVKLARAETHRDDLARSITQEAHESLHQKIKRYTPNQETSGRDLWPAIAKIKRELETIGGIDETAGEEYAKTKKRHDFLSSQVADLEGALEKTKRALKELDAIIEREFGAAFKKIEQGFNEYFSILFGGGNAKLVLHKESELSALHEELASELSDEDRERLARSYKMGIEIMACPPNKKVSTINMLSGGERALTSIALISAIIHSNPSPFVVLDEMDAALDEANSVRFAEILERLSRDTQFIAITHNRATMEKADMLYGVTMGDDGVSKLLSVDLAKAMENVEE